MAVRTPPSSFDRWHAYRWMYLSRRFEEITKRLWMEGLISGEMHLGMGEEAVAAGIVSHMNDQDAMALHHRATPFLLMRGLDPAALLSEFLGREGGLCRGMGGHMHLYAQEKLSASSGVIGASGPCGLGFALAAEHVRPGSVAVAVFGEGALNQGMLLESMNLAASWRLPLIFVCLDDSWSITIRSNDQRSATICQRAEGFDIPCEHVDGLDGEAVWRAGGAAFERARAGRGPTFLHASCVHPEGHFLGDLLLEVGRDPIRRLPPIALPLVKSALTPGGASIRDRLYAVLGIFQRLRANLRDRTRAADPLKVQRLKLTSDPERLTSVELEVEKKLQAMLETVLGKPEEVGGHAHRDI